MMMIESVNIITMITCLIVISISLWMNYRLLIFTARMLDYICLSLMVFLVIYNIYTQNFLTLIITVLALLTVLVKIISFHKSYTIIKNLMDDKSRWNDETEKEKARILKKFVKFK